MDRTELEKALLDALQVSVPLVERPYGQLGRQIGLSEAGVIAAVGRWGQAGGILREIAGIFDAAALGFASTLAGAQVDPDSLEQAGKIVAAHPGVSHCYSRQGACKLWFTLVVPPESPLGLPGTLERLGVRMAARRIASFPSLRRYKLQVRFTMSDDAEFAQVADTPPVASAGPLAQPQPLRPDREQIQAIRALQQPLSAVAEPFRVLAAAEGMATRRMLKLGQDLLGRGVLRRYAAVLRHRLAGAAVNVLVAWQVPEDRADAFGNAAAAMALVSHCYLRPPAPQWPYTLYTMMHAPSQEQIEQAVAQLRSQGDFPHALLPTGREFKKAKVRLYSDEFSRWESDEGISH